jgi:hypothetical protein
MDNAKSFLASRLEILDKSGTSLDISLVARALQVSNGDGAEAAFEILAKNRHEEGSLSYWGHTDECDDALSIRSSALALLVYVTRGEFLTESIVRWLNQKRQSSAGWGSTIDTLLATESLVLWSIKFGQDSSNIDGGLALEVDSKEGRRQIVVVGAKSLGHELANIIKLESHTKQISIEAKGHGLALVQLASKYATTSRDELDKENNELSAFNLEPRLESKSYKSDFFDERGGKKLMAGTQLLVLSCQR